MNRSVVGKDVLGPLPVEAVDGPDTNHGPVRGNRVDSGPAELTSTAVDAGPRDGQDVVLEGAHALLDGTGDDPGNRVDTVDGFGDGHGSGILDAGRVDTVDDIGSDDADLIALPGHPAGAPHEQGDHSERNTDSHADDGTGGGFFSGRPRWMWVAGVTLATLVVSVLAFAIFEPIQVLPRIRLAPGYALTNQDGNRVTSEDHRGAVTLYTFTYTECPGECFSLNETMAEIHRRVTTEIDLAGIDFELVTISFDTERDTPEVLSAAAAELGADPDDWQWLSGNSQTVRNVVGAGFKTWYEATPDGFDFDPAFVLVDGNGIVRGEYRYQTLASDQDRITRHVGILAEEIRNAHGTAAIAYEAAHLFLCYP